MIEKTILSFDTSTKTGWAFCKSTDQGIVLLEYGQVKKSTEPEGAYPGNYVDWANLVFKDLEILLSKFKPDTLVVEETSSGSKSIYSQKILEWIHYLLAFFIKESKIETIYMLTEQWRRETGCYMSKDESKHNKEVKKYKDKNDTNIAYDTNGKRVGRITRKHVNIRRANEVFGKFLKEPLRKKDEDICDALLLAYSYHLRRIKNE